MGKRSDALAADLESAVADLIVEIERTPDKQWMDARGPEGWSVAGTAQHVSGQFGLEREYVDAWAEGRPAPTYTWDDVNSRNDARAAKNAGASKADVLRELRDNSAAAAAYIRRLSDEQLDRSMGLPLADGAVVTTQQVIESGVLIDHVRHHTQSMRAAS